MASILWRPLLQFFLEIMEMFEVMDVVQFHYFYSVQKFFGQALQSKNTKNTEKGKKEPTNEPMT